MLPFRHHTADPSPEMRQSFCSDPYTCHAVRLRRSRQNEAGSSEVAEKAQSICLGSGKDPGGTKE